MTLQDWIERKQIVERERDTRIMALPISYSGMSSMVGVTVVSAGYNGMAYQAWSPN